MRANRLSIARLMGVVLILSFGLTAVRNASHGWAYATVLVVGGILMIAVVGAVYGARSERIWWLGFALFGWGYLRLTLSSESPWDGFPTIKLVNLLVTQLGSQLPLEDPPRALFASPTGIKGEVVVVIHALWSLAFAATGGLLARVFFSPGAGSPVLLVTDARSLDKPSRREHRWIRRCACVTAVLLMAAGAIVSARHNSGLFLGGILFLTWCLIGTFALAAIYTRGTQGARWLGATLFGAGYLVLIFSPDDFPELSVHRAINESIRNVWPAGGLAEPVYPPSSPGVAVANERIRKILAQPVAIEFPDPTPLDEVLAYIKAATQRENEPALPIYIDHYGVRNSYQTLQSPVSLQLVGVPLKTSLQRLLKPLGMTFAIREGILEITHEDPDEWDLMDDPMFFAGHLVLALLVAGVGGLVAPLVARSDHEPSAAAPMT